MQDARIVVARCYGHLIRPRLLHHRLVPDFRVWLAQRSGASHTRSDRFHTLLGLPKRSGRSLQETAVLSTYSTALMNRRLSAAVRPGSPALPGR